VGEARPLFHVKICGITVPADAAVAARCGADAIGINFVAGSPRHVDVATAREVAAAAGPGVLVVGVFAGMPAEEIAAIVTAVGLGAVQLHGHLSGAGPLVDPPEACGAVARAAAGVPVIRGVRFGPDGLADARRWMTAAAAAGGTPALAVIDAPVTSDASASALGGTGVRVDWAALAAEPPIGVPWALAGGLDPRNVSDAIRISGARAVDVASGVESAPGRKDAGMVRAFVAAARGALAGGPVRPPASG